MEQRCPIWGTPAEVRQGSGDYYVVSSPRAGGKYRISRDAADDLATERESFKERLTTWLVEQRRQGNSMPEVLTYTLDEVRTLRSRTVLERRDLALEFIADKSPNIGASVRLFGNVDVEVEANRAAFCAVTESKDFSEAQGLLRFLQEDGLLEAENEARLTFAGWSQFEAQRARRIPSVQAFVAMWFDPSMTEAYERGFAPAIRASGYTPMRIDNKEHVNKIDDEIIAEIRRSRFLVADFTSEPERPRGGVYFEAGFAMGLNIPIIWTCRQDLIAQVHFDTRQFNHIVWSSPDDLHTRLKNRIGAVIGEITRAKTSPEVSVLLHQATKARRRRTRPERRLPSVAPPAAWRRRWAQLFSEAVKRRAQR